MDSSSILNALVIAAVPVAAGFSGWMIKLLVAVSRNNAVAAEKLSALDDRTTRLEDVVFKPAWMNGRDR